MILDPCLRCGIRGESDHCFIRDRKGLATDCVTSGRRLRGREEEKGEPRRAQPACWVPKRRCEKGEFTQDMKVMNHITKCVGGARVS